MKIGKWSDVCEWLPKVNKQRREKILCCKNEQDKLRSLMAGLLLRFALEQEGIDYETAEFGYGPYGKPMLLRYKPVKRVQTTNKVFFSLTHCEQYVGCAISDENIGMDLETSNRSLFSQEKEKQFFSMAKRICTPKEYAYFLSLPKEEQIRTYLEIWTRKESFAKEDGRGLAIGFEKIEVFDNPDFETKWITTDTCMSIYSKNLTKHTITYSYMDILNAEPRQT